MSFLVVVLSQRSIFLFIPSEGKDRFVVGIIRLFEELYFWRPLRRCTCRLEAFFSVSRFFLLTHLFGLTTRLRRHGSPAGSRRLSVFCAGPQGHSTEDFPVWSHAPLPEDGRSSGVDRGSPLW